jgi:hypothetical protein
MILKELENVREMAAVADHPPHLLQFHVFSFVFLGVIYISIDVDFSVS